MKNKLSSENVKHRRRVDCLNRCNEIEFFKKIQIEKNNCEIQHEIALSTNRGGYLKPMHQLLLVLKILCDRNMLISIADFIEVFKSSARQIVKRVSPAITFTFNPLH